MTQKPLPAICDFPMFMTVGEVSTSLDVNYAVIKLDAKLLQLVKQWVHFKIVKQTNQLIVFVFVFEFRSLSVPDMSEFNTLANKAHELLQTSKGFNISGLVYWSTFYNFVSKRVYKNLINF